MTDCKEEEKGVLVETYANTVPPEGEAHNRQFFFLDFRICSVKLLLSIFFFFYDFFP